MLTGPSRSTPRKSTALPKSRRRGGGVGVNEIKQNITEDGRKKKEEEICTQKPPRRCERKGGVHLIKWGVG